MPIRGSRLFEQLDPGWKSAILAHYGAIAVPEYVAGIGESRMGRFGRAAAWRNMATFGTLDETRHGQIQTYFPYGLLAKEPRADWAHKTFHTNEWGAIAARSLALQGRYTASLQVRDTELERSTFSRLTGPLAPPGATKRPPPAGCSRRA